MNRVSRFILTACLLAAAGCAPLPAELPTPSHTPHPPTATSSPTDSPTPLPTQVPTATITPTPAWVFQPAGRIICPIILYHRVAEPTDPGALTARYYVPPQQFELQMQTLQEWGYTTIPLSLLVTAITDGAALPPRPIIITFDDGDASVYEQAFPIMARHGFTGVAYLVVNYLGREGYMDTAQVKDLAAAGWEIGSHSLSHVDMVNNPDLLRREGYDSRLELEQLLALPVDTFAYPFGAASPFITDHIDGYGYTSAVGLGTLYSHAPHTLFYLSRIEIRNPSQPEDLAALLPWSGPVEAASPSAP